MKISRSFVVGDRVKRCFLLLLAAVFIGNGPIYAQAKADILAVAADKIKAGSVFDFNFSAVNGKGERIYEEDGRVAVLGNKFRMEMPDELLVVCNGAVKWIYKPEAEELIIAENNAGEPDMLENPFSVLEGASRFYRVAVGTGVKTLNGKSVKTITLTPLQQKNNYNRIDILLEKERNIPAMIEFFSIDGSRYTARIKKFSGLADRSSAQFELDPARYPEAVVTDLR